ncbi:isochorismatase family protein [Paraburkholderia sp. A2WS-5]|uniref:isochorismatase family protein n=1 Tax=unclassified Paraburkholderia TaxID=2615204 RepID=UPI003B7B6504
MLHTLEASVVVLVDLQRRLIPAIHEGAMVVAQAARLGRIAQLLDVPIIGTEQSPQRLGENAETIKDLCSNTVVKDHFDATAEGLVDALPAGRTRIIVAGCEAHVCVLQTVIGLLSHGLQVTLVKDAIGSRKTSDRDTAIDRLARAGADVSTVEMVAFEWLRSSQHPQFRDVLRLIK